MNARPIYLDHHASTPCDPRVVEAMLPYFSSEFGNAASHAHAYGWAASNAVHDARIQVMDLVGARSPDEIVFTSGATESNNLALRGVVEATGGKHVITSVIEHPCVLRACDDLEARGIQVTRLGVDERGLVSPRDLQAALRPDTALISIMAVNNEIGTIQPVRELAAIAHEHGALFHTDAAQAVGRIPLDVHRDRIDLLSMSAHKLNGPKGVGALYVRRAPRDTPLYAQMHGGGQERAKRSGTSNVPGIVGFGVAARITREDSQREDARLRALRDGLLEALRAALTGVHVHGCMEQRVACNLNLSFEGIRADTLQAAVPALAISGGAACSSGKAGTSHVLQAMGVREDLMEGAIRIGLGRTTTTEDVETAARVLIAAVGKRRAGPRSRPAA
jgi:cysteine desulfurase